MKLGNLSAGSRDISLASRRYFNARQYADFSWRKPFVGARKVLVEWQNPLVANISGGRKYAQFIYRFQLSAKRLWLLQQDGDNLI